MLCYRCGSYNPDGSRKCTVCGQAFSTQRRSTRNLSSAAATAGRIKTPFEPGSRIAGRYRVAYAVAQGSAGWVLRARDEEVDVDVAVKVISPNLLQTEDERAHFLKTVKAARRVAHPNVVRIYDEGRDERHVFYTTAYLEGLTLRKIIDLRLEKDQVFSIAEVLPLFGQLALGLDNLDKFLAHASLGPSNITVLPDILKITGLPHLFGLPRRPFIAQQQQRGSLDYVAPEARREGTEIDARADVYSMAVMLGEMLTGQVFGKDPMGWTKALRQVPRRLGGLVGQALADRPDDRFATVGAFFDAIAEAIADTQFDNPDPVSLGKPNKRLEALVEEHTVADTSPSKASAPPPLAMESSTSDAVNQSLAPELIENDLGKLSRTIADQPPARWAERRGQSAPAQKPGARWAYLLGAVIVLGGAGVGTAMWWKAQSPQIDLHPVANTPVVQVAPTLAVVEDKLRTPDPKPEIKPEPKPKPKADPKPDPKPDTKLQKDAPTPPEAPVVPKGCAPGMVEVDGGPFEFGSSPSDPMRGFGELSAKRTAVERFCIDIFEYPNQRGKAPVTNVTWQRAKQSCEKAGKRLCSETEWELACKGVRSLRFPFGQEFSPGVCNIGAGGKPLGAGEFGRCRSGYGVADLAGNVAEWTASRWSDDVPDKVVKGGAADQASYTGRCSARVNEPAGGRNDGLGFRCCGSLGD